MLTLLMAQNLLQAEFIQKGFFYENLSVDIFSLQNVMAFSDFENRIGFADGIFLLTNDIDFLEGLIVRCRAVRPNVPICVLTECMDARLHQWIGGGLIQFFFIRPFPFRQIVAEMKFQIFKNSESLVQSLFIHRDLELDVVKHQVKVKKEPVYLRNKEFSLLHFLMANKGKVLSKTSILENVWDHNTNISTSTVDVHISQLRRKIDKRANDTYIRTIPCTGYVLD